MTKEKLINLYNKIISTNPLLWEDPYQKEILTNPEFFTSNKPQVIAGAVGFGKTPVAIISSEMEIAMNPKIKILTIPYSTKVLRSNYYECYEELFPGHSCIILNLIVGSFLIFLKYSTTLATPIISPLRKGPPKVPGLISIIVVM